LVSNCSKLLLFGAALISVSVAQVPDIGKILGRKPAPPGTPTAPVFHAESRLVNLTLIATDKNGNPVVNLKPEQVEVLENGVPQKLRVFEAAYTGGKPSPGKASPQPGPAATAAGVEAASRPRYVAFVVDNTGTSAADRARAFQAIEKWLRSNSRPTDLLGLFVLGEQLTFQQRFTTDHEAFLDSLRHAAKGAAAVDLELEMNQLVGEMNTCMSIPDTTIDKKLQRLCVQIEARRFSISERPILRRQETSLETLLRYLEPFAGEKRVVYLGDGFYVDPGEIAYQASTMYFGEDSIKRGEMLATPQRFFTSLKAGLRLNGVTITAIDLAGLESGEEANAAAVVPFSFGEGKVNAPTPEQPNPVAVSPSRSFHELLRVRHEQQEQSLSDLADAGGGKVIHNTNDLLGAVTAAVGNGEGSYYLAYAPSDKRLKGDYRTITVRTLDPRIQLRTTRGGYYAVAPRPLPIDVAVLPETDSAPTILLPVRCAFDPKALAWQGRDDLRTDEFLVVRTLKRLPNQIIFSHTEAWTAQPDASGKVAYGLDLKLVPGSYAYTLSFTETSTSNYATAEIPLQVPAPVFK